MKKLIISLILMTSISAFAQTDRIDSLLNDLVYNDNDPLEMPEKPVKYDFIYAGLNFSSSSFYAGREVGSDMFSLSGNMFYYHSSGIYLGASGSWFNELDPSYTNTVISTGYSKSIDKKEFLSFRTSYSRYLYNQSDSGNYPYKNNFSLGLSFRKKWIRARIGTNVLFGDESKINLSSALYSRFTLAKIGKYNKLYTTPEVSVFFGKESVSVTKINKQIPDPTQEYEDVFSLLNTQICIPLGLSIGNFDFDVSYYVNLPTTRDVNISYPVKSFFSISIGYMLPVAK